MSSTAESVNTNAAQGDTSGLGGHPKGLSTLFMTEMWERFSYYGLRPLLVLFMSAALMDGGFGFDRGAASAIVGIYGASVYLASLPGGWVADRLLGLRRAILYGAICISAGHISIGLSAFAGGKVNAVKKATPKSIEAMTIAERIRRLRMFRIMIVPFLQVR